MLKDALRIVEERDNLVTAVEMGYVSEDIARPDIERLTRELNRALSTAA